MKMVMAMKYEIGARIRKFREQAGLSQIEFAEKIGVSNARVHNWEKGINRPDVDKLPLICSVLNIRADEILDISDADINRVSYEDMARIKKYHALCPQGKRMVDFILNDEFFYQPSDENNEQPNITYDSAASKELLKAYTAENQLDSRDDISER